MQLPDIADVLKDHFYCPRCENKSNEKLREAALTLKLEENEEYQELTGKGWELDTEESTLATEHNRLVVRKEILMM